MSLSPAKPERFQRLFYLKRTGHLNPMEALSPTGNLIPLKIRPMELADVHRVQEIDQLSFSLPWSERSYIFELTENPSTLALVAELQRSESQPELIGMSIVWLIIDEAHIATIAIHPDYRGKGYGKILLVETLRQSIRKGAVSATLEVRQNNLLAQRLYSQFGFTIVGRRERYYRDNDEDAILMTVDRLNPDYLNMLDKLSVTNHRVD